MDEIKISKAEEQDLPYIKEKLVKYVLDSTDLVWNDFFVARNSTRPVGFARLIDRGDFFEIASLGVDYYHRKKRIGTKLLFFLIDQAKKLNQAKPLYIVTHIPELFKKIGFREIDSYPAHLEHKKNHKCQLEASRIRIMKYL